MTTDTVLWNEFRTPRGRAASLFTREGTNDFNSGRSCLDEDEYELGNVELGEGVAVDMGAHIGGATIALALDNEHARVIAVEALSENVTMIERNVELNEVGDRVSVVHAAGAKAGRKSVNIEWNFSADELGQHHRYIGNAVGWIRDGSQHEKVKALNLTDLVTMAGGHIDFMKIDCETCEYALLDSPAIKDVTEIRGEYHAGVDRLMELLDDTHHVTTWGLETLGGFKAVRR